MNQEPKIGSQADFNKFADSKSQSINPDPGEFDRLLERETADAEAMQAFDDAERTDALKDLALYEADAKASEGVMNTQDTNQVSAGPEQTSALMPVSDQPKELVRQ
jgi:hypothetical protein